MDKQKQIEEMRFKVIDNNTGKEADICEIALKEDWAKDLIYCDMQGFAILDDGNLVLLDECGKYVYCPNGRFSVIPENAVVLTREEYEKLKLFEERVRSGVCFTQKEWFDYCQKDSNERTSLLIKAKKDTRKETSEKFAERLKASKTIKAIFGEGWIFSYVEVCKEIDEIAKEMEAIYAKYD